MAAPAPVKQSVPQNKTKLLKDTSCHMMCPECYVRGTVLALEDDATTWGCPKCGLQFAVEWDV